MPDQFGIIGYPLSHSFSAAYFRKKFADEHIDATYDPFPLADIREFPALLASHPALRGLSVTIPHKQSVMPFLTELDRTAAEAGAVNSIRISGGCTTGYNTDIAGFEQSLAPLLTPHHTHALLLGTGGASKAVAYVLRQLGLPFETVSRTPKAGCKTYDTLTPALIKEYKLIINTTPAGMYPNVHACPDIPYEGITVHHLLYDLIYNPEETLFLKQGKERGAAIKNGFEMLHIQAEASWQLWTSPQPRPH